MRQRTRNATRPANMALNLVPLVLGTACSIFADSSETQMEEGRRFGTPSVLSSVVGSSPRLCATWVMTVTVGLGRGKASFDTSPRF